MLGLSYSADIALKHHYNIVETLFAVKGVSFNFSEHKKVLLNPSLAITNAMSSPESTYTAQ